jgi:cell pole-organizing protein PopZ
MEDILASIRRILSEEDPPFETTAEPAVDAAAAAEPPRDDVLLLDPSMLVNDPARQPAGRSHPLPADLLARIPLPPPPPILPVTDPAEIPAEAPATESETSTWAAAEPSATTSDEPPAEEANPNDAPAVTPPMTEGPDIAPEEEPAPLVEAQEAAPEAAAIPRPAESERIEIAMPAAPMPPLAEPPPYEPTPVRQAQPIADPEPRPPSASAPVAQVPPVSPVLVPVPRAGAPVAVAPELARFPANPSSPDTTPRSENSSVSASLSAPPQYTGGGIASPETAMAAAGSVTNLVRALTTERGARVHNEGPTIADLVREELRPLLKAWLDANLPPMVERLVRQEIERVISRAGV